jgi:uracil-DNA glycosylase
MRKTLGSLSSTSAADFLPDTQSLRTLAEASQRCRGCPLHANATQAVFGEGPKNASVVFVGEQPGDAEDIAGEPFVGPAGRLLDSVMDEVGIERTKVYVTNAVKHFKWTPKGKRRMHAKPSSREMAACKPWLEAELELIKPKVLVCLGATAAQSLLGRSFRPSAVLRAKQTDQADEVMAAFRDDLMEIARLINSHGQRKPR